MKFVCEIDMNNAAFEGQPYRELGRLLTSITGKVNLGHPSGTCVDMNGNSVGTWNVLGPHDADVTADGSSIAVITMECEADVTEEWQVAVSEHDLERLREEPEDTARELINGDRVIDVQNIAVNAERNRQFVNWMEK